MGAFEALNENELFAVDGGASFGQVAGLMGGAIAFSWGAVVTWGGICSLNPALVAAGVACAGAGAALFTSNL